MRHEYLMNVTNGGIVIQHLHLSNKYNVEQYYLTNHPYENIEDIIVTIMSSKDLGIEAEYDIIGKSFEVDGYVGQFKTREDALRAAEKCIYSYLKNFK